MGIVPLKNELVIRPINGDRKMELAAILLVSFVGHIDLVCDFCQYLFKIQTHESRSYEDTKGQCVAIYSTSTLLH